MSLILEALNRAEQERKQSQPAPDLSSQPVVFSAETFSPHYPSKKRYRVALGAIIILVICVSAWFITRGYFSGVDIASVVKAQLVPEVKAPRVNVATELKSDQIAENVVLPDSPKGDPAEKLPSTLPVSEISDLYAVDEVSVSLSEPEETQGVNELYAEPEPQMPLQQVYERSLDTTVAGLVSPSSIISEAYVTPVVNEPVKMAISNSGDQTSAENTSAEGLFLLTDIPWFGDLSWQVRMEIPSINYSQHNYMANKSSRVMINGEMVGVGQRSGEFSVKQIEQNGVVLERKNVIFKLAALNGWINL
jgi:general secretion pathway protein B